MSFFSQLASSVSSVQQAAGGVAYQQQGQGIQSFLGLPSTGAWQAEPQLNNVNWDFVNLWYQREQEQAQRELMTLFQMMVGGGGGGGGGGNITIGGDNEVQAPRNDAEALAYVKANFPQYSWLMNDAEVANALMTSAYSMEDTAQAEARIKGTQWYQSRTAYQRNYDIAYHTDPSSLEASYREKLALVQDMAGSLGINADEVNPEWFARFALREGFSNEQMLDYMVDAITMNTVGRTGGAQQMFQNVRQTGLDYFIAMDDAGLLDHTKKVLRNERSIDDVRGNFRELAKQRWSHLAQKIDEGVTLKDYFAPMQHRIAQMLELNMDDVDLVNGEYQKIIDTVDGKTGDHRAMYQWEVEDLVRQDKRWKYTDGARRQASSLMNAIGQIFGTR